MENFNKLSPVKINYCCTENPIANLMHQKTEQIWKACSNKLLQFIRFRISDSSYAEDILQEVFIKIHSKIDTVQDETKIPSWVYQITRNTIIDHYRKPKLKYEDLDEMHEVLPDHESFISPAEDNVDEIDSMTEIASGLKDMIAELPEKYSQALLLVEIEGLSQVQLAEKLGISVSGAKSRVQRGRQMLKDILMQCCHYEFDKYGTIISHHEHCCCCN